MTTLYISDIKTSIKLSSRHLDLFRDNDSGTAELQSRIPLHCLERVAVVGRSRVSMRAVHEFMRRDIPVHVLEPMGSHAGSFLPHRDGDAFQRIRQYRLYESPWALQCACALVAEKLLASRRVLQRLAARDTSNTGHPDLIAALAQLKALAGDAARSETTSALRGIEGAASAAYFRALACLFPDSLRFSGRNRRPPRDPVNALLSWTYTMVANEVRGAIEAAGLDPCIGVYHALGYARPALALDIMEPFRAPLCDMLVVRLLNLGIIKDDDFSNDPENGCRLEQEGRRKFFEQYEKRMSAEFRLPAETLGTCYRDLIRRSAAAFSEALRTGKPYKPFEVR